MDYKKAKIDPKFSVSWEEIAADGIFDDVDRQKVFEVLGSRQRLTLLDLFENPNIQPDDKLWLAYNRFGFTSSWDNKPAVDKDAEDKLWLIAEHQGERYKSNLLHRMLDSISRGKTVAQVIEMHTRGATRKNYVADTEFFYGEN